MNELVEILAAFGGTFFFSALYHLKGVKLLTAGLGGMCTWIICIAAESLAGSRYIAFLLSAMAASAAAELLARWFKTPTTTFAVPMLIPLIPGGSLYYAMSAAVNSDWAAFAVKGQETIYLSLMLAAGIMAVSSIQKLLRGLRSFFRRRKSSGTKTTLPR